MVNRRKALRIEESNKDALSIINNKGPIFNKTFQKIKGTNKILSEDVDCTDSESNNSHNILKGGSNLSAYGGSGGVINCEVYWDNKLPADAFLIERN